MAASPDQDLPTTTKLAVERTRLAHERTLMASVRTATSLISFGFTIYKFFEYLRESQGAPTSGAIGPRGFGGLMIGIGIASLILATVGTSAACARCVPTTEGSSLIRFPRSFAALIGVLGVFLLVAVLLRM